MLLAVLVSSVVLIIIIAWFLWTSEETKSGGITNRGCPVCGASLDMNERVYADQISRKDKPDEISIKGCSRCYDRPSDQGD